MGSIVSTRVLTRNRRRPHDGNATVPPARIAGRITRQRTVRWWIPKAALPLLAPVHVLVLGVIVIPALYVVWLSLTSPPSARRRPSSGSPTMRMRCPIPTSGARCSTRSSSSSSSFMWNWCSAWHGAALRERAPGAALAARGGARALCGQRGLGRGDVAFPVRCRCRARDGRAARARPADARMVGRPGARAAHHRLLSIWLHLPFTFIILYAARLAIPTQLYEAARVDAVARCRPFATSRCRC